MSVGTASKNQANNARARQQCARNKKELKKLEKAESELAKTKPAPGSDEEKRKQKLSNAIAKKKSNLDRQNTLLDKLTKTDSKQDRKNLKDQIDKLQQEAKASKLKTTTGGDVCIKCELVKGKIVSAEILDGSDTKTLSGTGVQYVNLNRDAKWVDGKYVKNIDRLSQLIRVKIKFDRPGHHSFRLKLVPGGKNAKYTAAELARNGAFKHHTGVLADRTLANGEKIVSAVMNIASAGDNTYKIEAEDIEGTKKKSKGEVKTDRLVYFREFKMDHANVKPATNIGKFKSAFKECFITMEQLGSEKITHLPNVGTNTGDLQQLIHDAFIASPANAKAPYALALVYTDHLAVKRDNRSLATPAAVPVGPGKPAVTIAVKGSGLTNPAVADRYLWKNLVPGEGWLEDATYHPSDGSASIDVAAKCIAVGGDMSKQVKIDVTGLPAGTGIIRIKVNWVDRMRGGLALGSNNVAIVCTRAWWKTKTNDAQVHVMIHEVGHQVQMVPDGTGIRPDKVATHYWGGNKAANPTKSDKGHVGDHCYNGNADGQARYDASADRDNAICVMYGSTKDANQTFCANCKPSARKVDISGGWATV